MRQEHQENDQEAGTFRISAELAKGSTMHDVTSTVVITTKEKLELKLVNCLTSMSDRRAWMAPSGIVIALLIPLCTSDFKDTFGLKADFWLAFTSLLLLASTVWLVVAIVKCCKCKPLTAGGIVASVVEDMTKVDSSNKTG